MRHFFPRSATAWHLEEPAALRKLSLSLLEMGVLAGVVLRLYRALVLGLAGSAGFTALGGALVAGVAFLLVMAAMHLGNFPVRTWLWRAPAFALVAAGAELLVSLLLIATGHEPLGTGRATFGDWPGIAVRVLLVRVVLVCTFAIALAGVVQLVRAGLLRREHRAHTVQAVHAEHAPHRDHHDATHPADRP
ncbi:MAG TPA: hypothetical protein VHQ45_07070 [Gemmatimonadaceae bacterium]|jgi:hypothetical protein|nr:hypothetical protein [Gemmatimonadaceae bacterium]